MAGGPRPDRVAGWEGGVRPGMRKAGRFTGEKRTTGEAGSELRQRRGPQGRWSGSGVTGGGSGIWKEREENVGGSRAPGGVSVMGEDGTAGVVSGRGRVRSRTQEREL